MKLIIDIDEDYYKAIWENGYIYDEDNEDIAKAIRNGTPLPKGHGRLIDANYFREDSSIFDIIPFTQRMNIECVVDHAPTIIEADKGE